jgi:fibronectin type 3 domain-containing protein
VKWTAACLILLLFALALAPALQADELPGAPLSLKAEREGTRIYISWQPPEGNVTVLRYNVYRGSEANYLQYYDSLDGNYTAGYDMEVVRDQRYYYAVSANTTAGEGAMSEVVFVDVPSNDYPVMVMGTLIAIVSVTLIFAYWKGRGSGPAP